MNPQRILTIIDREWTQTFTSWSAHATVWLHPLIVTGALLGFLRLLIFGSHDPQLYDRAMDYYLTFFAIMPLVNTTRMSATGIIADKASRSLEPLLATPLTTSEFIFGKMLAAMVPNVFIMWIAYGIFACVANHWNVSQSYLFGSTVSPACFCVMFFVSPLLTGLAANTAFFIASRKTDAQQAANVSTEVSGLFMILPLIGVFLAQRHQHIIGTLSLLEVIGGLLAANAVFFLFSIKLFQRETILFKWK